MFIDRLEKLDFSSKSRDYIGASQLGNSCDRAIWLGRHSKRDSVYGYKKHDIFQRGDLEERRIIDHLRKCRFKIIQEQVEVWYHSLKGHADAIIQDMESGEKFVLEIKTMNDRNFKEWVKKGTKETKLTYYVQCQCYMGMLDIHKSLIVVRNKNDETLAEEIIDFDEGMYKMLLLKADTIENSDIMPLGYKIMGHKHFMCKMCDYEKECWNDI